MLLKFNCSRNCRSFLERLSSGSWTLLDLLMSLLATVMKVSTQLDIFDGAYIFVDFASNTFLLNKAVQDRMDLRIYLSLFYMLAVITSLFP